MDRGFGRGREPAVPPPLTSPAPTTKMAGVVPMQSQRRADPMVPWEQCCAADSFRSECGRSLPHCELWRGSAVEAQRELSRHHGIPGQASLRPVVRIHPVVQPQPTASVAQTPVSSSWQTSETRSELVVVFTVPRLAPRFREGRGCLPASRLAVSHRLLASSLLGITRPSVGFTSDTVVQRADP